MSIVLLVGASGSGKSTIGKMLEDKYDYKQLISFTTRPKRKGEVHGVDYYFLSKEDLESMDLVESSEYNGNIYGLSADEVKLKTEMYPNVYFISDKNGAKQIATMYPFNTYYFWINTTIETMIKRMRKRGDSSSQIISRFEHAVDTRELYPPVDHIETVYIMDAEDKTADSARWINEVSRSKFGKPFIGGTMFFIDNNFNRK